MGTPPQFMDMPMISVSYVEHLLDVLEARGCERTGLIAAWGKNPELLAKRDARVTSRDLMTLLAHAQKFVSLSGIGYALGMEIKLTSHGLLGLAVLSCKNLREAIRLVERFAPLRTGLVEIRLIEEDETAIIQIDYIAHMEELRPFVLEVTICATIAAGDFLLGGLSPKTEVWLEQAEPGSFGEWRHLLPRFRFSMPSNQIRFPAASLDELLTLSSPTSAHAATAYLETELTMLRPPADMKSRTRVLLESGSRSFHSLQKVADEIGISSSTLKRRLQQEGSTFQMILDEVRCAKAIRYLEGSAMSVDDVAQALGYADPTNFSRAFRKWTGHSPAVWRLRTNAVSQD